MKTIKTTLALTVLVVLSTTSVFSQQKEKTSMKQPLKTYLIERDIPGAGDLTGEQLAGISQNSCSVIKEMGTGIEWLHSYVTEDKVYCVYRAENKEMIKEHAEKGGFPANSIKELSTTIGPATDSNPDN